MMMVMMSRGECGERVGLIAWWLLRPSEPAAHGCTRLLSLHPESCFPASPNSAKARSSGVFFSNACRVRPGVGPLFVLSLWRTDRLDSARCR